MNKITSEIFWLSVILIVVAYYAGATKFGVSILNVFDRILLHATGRRDDGTFAGYPGNAPSI